MSRVAASSAAAARKASAGGTPSATIEAMAARNRTRMVTARRAATGTGSTRSISSRRARPTNAARSVGLPRRKSWSPGSILSVASGTLRRAARGPTPTTWSRSSLRMRTASWLRPVRNEPWATTTRVVTASLTTAGSSSATRPVTAAAVHRWLRETTSRRSPPSTRVSGSVAIRSPPRSKASSRTDPARKRGSSIASGIVDGAVSSKTRHGGRASRCADWRMGRSRQPRRAR